MAKGKHPQKDRHHITPRSRGGTNGKQNLKRVPFNAHTAYHLLFINLTPDEVIRYLNEVWFNPSKAFIRPYDWLLKQEE